MQSILDDEEPTVRDVLPIARPRRRQHVVWPPSPKVRTLELAVGSSISLHAMQRPRYIEPPWHIKPPRAPARPLIALLIVLAIGAMFALLGAIVALAY